MRRRVRRLAVVLGGCGGAVLGIFAVSRLGIGGSAFGLDGGVGELATYGARAREYVVPPGTNPLFGDRTADYLTARQHGSNPGETVLYVGLLTLALAGAWLVAGIARRRTWTVGGRYLLVMLPSLVVAGVLFSLPSPLSVAGTALPMPARLVHAFAPEFRVPSRFIVVVMAALVPMAALGLAGVARRASAAARRVGGARVATALAAGVVALAVAGSQLELRTDRTLIVPLDEAPPEYALVDRTPPGILVEYPLLAARDPGSSDTLVWQRMHGRRLLNGAPAGTPGDGVRTNLFDPSSRRAAGALAALGVTAVIDRRDRSRPLELGPGYALVGRTPDGVAVWRVTAQPGVAVSLAGFGEPEPAGPGTWQQWSGVAEGTIGFYAGTAGVYRADFRVGSYGPGRRLRFTGRGARQMPVGAIEPHTLLVRLPAGRSQITWSTDPGPQPIPDGRSVGITMSNWTVRPAPSADGAVGAIQAVSVPG
jgi:hypothetical protein